MTVFELIEKLCNGIAMGVISKDSEIYLEDSELKREECPVHLYAQDQSLIISAFSDPNATEL